MSIGHVGAGGTQRVAGRLRCRIGRVSLPPEHGVDTGDLAWQVEQELSRLLALGPAAGMRGFTAGHVRLRLTSPATTANVAHSIAHHLYRQLSGWQEDRP